MDGLTTIRVFKTEHVFRQKFAELQDTHTSLWYTYTSVSRALGIWTDWVCLTYVFSTAMMLMYLSDSKFMFHKIRDNVLFSLQI